MFDWWDTLKNYGDYVWRVLGSGEYNTILMGTAMFVVLVIASRWYHSKRYVEYIMAKNRRRDDRLKANELVCKGITEDFESAFRAGNLSREQVDRLYAELRKSPSFRGVGPEQILTTRPWYHGVAAHFRPEMVKDGILKRLKNLGWSKVRVKEYLNKRRRERTKSDMQRLAESIKRRSN